MNELYGLEVLLLDEAVAFLKGLEPRAADKVLYNIDRVAHGERDSTLFKKLANTNIWEFRTLYRKQAYRLFAFWDTGNRRLIVATHGIMKKSMKTPSTDIRKAEDIRKRYFEEREIWKK